MKKLSLLLVLLMAVLASCANMTNDENDSFYSSPHELIIGKTLDLLIYKSNDEFSSIDLTKAETIARVESSFDPNEVYKWSIDQLRYRDCSVEKVIAVKIYVDVEGNRNNSPWWNVRGILQTNKGYVSFTGHGSGIEYLELDNVLTGSSIDSVCNIIWGCFLGMHFSEAFMRQNFYSEYDYEILKIHTYNVK